jgi:hypothetical protein
MTDPSATPAPVEAPASPPAHARHAAPGGTSDVRRHRLIAGGAVAVAIGLVVLIVILVSGGGGPAPSGFTAANPGQATKASGANATALRQIDAYNTSRQHCGSNITCIEKADRTMGDGIHVYANYLGSLSQSGAAGKIVGTALNTAQVTANTFEILGDAQPTQANYNQVLAHFNLQGQVNKLTKAINDLAGVLHG